MSNFIQKIANTAIKSISEQVAKAYISVLASQNVTIDGETKTEDELLEIYYTHFAELFEPKKSGFMLFCKKQKPELVAQGLNFQECAIKLGELWATADQEKWDMMANCLTTADKYIGKHCVFWYEGTNVEDDQWVKGLVTKYQTKDLKIIHTISYTDPCTDEADVININIYEWIDDEYFAWISSDDYHNKEYIHEDILANTSDDEDYDEDDNEDYDEDDNEDCDEDDNEDCDDDVVGLISDIVDNTHDD